MTPQVEQAVSFFIKKNTLIKMIEDQKEVDTDLLHFSAVFRTSGEVNLVITAVKPNSELGKGFPAFFKQGAA